MDDLLITNQYGVTFEASSFEGEEVLLLICSDMTVKTIYLDKEHSTRLRDWLNEFLEKSNER